MITVATDEDTFSIDADLSISLENLQALLEADTNIPPAQQVLYCNGNRLTEASKSLEQMGVKADDLLLLRSSQGSSTGAQQSAMAANASGGQSSRGANAYSEEQAAETLRLELLGNPQMMAQLRSNRPELADAVSSNPARFVELLKQERQRASEAQQQRLRAEAELAAADEFDVEAQRRIEEAIRQEQVLENLESAMEYNPESFGRVTMLYVETEVNGTPVKAFVDSGAQATIMSPDCAERCGIMRLLDRRFAGIARGVGTAKILGRVHSAQIKLGDHLFLPCSFTIMEGRGVDLLFGLDMLKRHACVLDMANNQLVVHGQTIRFLDEHELPESARMADAGEEDEGGAPGGGSNEGLTFSAPPRTIGAVPGPGPHEAATANANAAARAATAGAPSRDMGGMSWNHPSSAMQTPTPSASAAAPAPAPASSASARPAAASAAGSKAWPAASLQTLKDLGATEAQAKALLDAAGGNVEVAASLLFQQ